MKKNNNENFFGDYIDIDIITPEKNTIKAKKTSNKFDRISKIIKSKYEECLRDLKEK
jgi:hypothetical protein|tara:strand:+ start:1680 stop:1850 length:171 start_codon:yes stop_codon:yes gene_type:complete